MGVLERRGSVSSATRFRGALNINSNCKMHQRDKSQFVYRLVFGRKRFPLLGLVPSKTFMAARSSGDIWANINADGETTADGFFIGDVSDFMFSFSISKRIFSLRLRRSSSFHSRVRLERAAFLSIQ